MSSSSPLGSLLMVRLEKQKYWVEDNWFCRYVKVEPPGETNVLTFPCYRWLVGDMKMEIREGTGRKLEPRADLESRRRSSALTVWAEKEIQKLERERERYNKCYCIIITQIIIKLK